MTDQIGTSPQRSPHESLVWPVVLTLVAFFVAHRSPVSYATSDPLGTLLTAEALVHHGTLKLDQYALSSDQTYLGNVGDLQESRGKFRLRRGHVYHHAPIGTVLFSVPFVWLENLRGPSMLDPRADAAVQNTLSAATVAVSFILVYLLARRFVSAPYNIILSAGLVFGGPLMSTMGTALWNSNLATVFMLGALIQLVRTERNGTVGSGLVLGILLFFAYLCRPTAMVMVLLTAVIAGWRGKRQFLSVVLSFLALSMLFVVFSWSEFGTLLPDYYVIRRFEKPSRYLVIIVLIAAFLGAFTWIILRALVSKTLRSGSGGSSIRKSVLRALVLCIVGVMFLGAIVTLIRQPSIIGKLYRVNKVEIGNCLNAVYGVLLSPSRGFVVFSPFLVVTGIGSIYVVRRKKTSPLFWLCAAWLLTHALMLARPYRWHGGHCYGPRLFTEAFPAAVVLTLIAWSSFDLLRRRGRRILRGSMLALMLVSVFVNTYQGVYNRYTAVWNTSPNVDSFPEYLFNWRYPQFLASPAQLDARNAAHERTMKLRKRMELEAGNESSQAVTEGPRRAGK